MEVSFMILWKPKVSDKTNLLQNIMDMLVELYPNTDDEKILFEYESNEIVELPYKCSKNRNEIVYLKIECGESDAKSARILSALRDKICNGKHRARYSIICNYDEASLSYCCRLMKTFGVFERRLRKLMYLIIVKTYGADWLNKSFSEDIKSKIKEKSKGLSDEKLSESILEFLDYSEIVNYLFSERRWDGTADEIIDEVLSDNHLESLSKEEIIDIISRARKESLWNKLFSKIEHINFITEDEIDNLRKCRNDIMHNHTLNEKNFKLMQKKIGRINKNLGLAISEMEDGIYANQSFSTLFASIGNVLSEFTNHISALFTSSFLESINIINTTIENAMATMRESISRISFPAINLSSFPSLKLSNYSESSAHSNETEEFSATANGIDAEEDSEEQL